MAKNKKQNSNTFTMKEPMFKVVNTFSVKIYMAGDINIIKQVCRKYCLEVGLCVTVTPTLFIYTGGEEFGVEIGLINYPRFPDAKINIIKKAEALAIQCREAACQHSYLIMTPNETIWNTTKEENKK